MNAHGWLTQEVLQKYRDNSLLIHGIWRGIANHSRPATSTIASIASSNQIQPGCSKSSSLKALKLNTPKVSHKSSVCPVCTITHASEKFYSLPCNHLFCRDCWVMHFEVQIMQVRLLWKFKALHILRSIRPYYFWIQKDKIY